MGSARKRTNSTIAGARKPQGAAWRRDAPGRRRRAAGGALGRTGVVVVTISPQEVSAGREQAGAEARVQQVGCGRPSPGSAGVAARVSDGRAAARTNRAAAVGPIP